MSFLSRARGESREPAHFRPSLEGLGERIVPANAHFVFASSTVSNSGALVVDFKEAGLGDNQEVKVELTGDANATYQWLNKGGNKPQGVPFNVNESFEVTGTFSSDKNGNVVGSLTANPPSVDAFLATKHAANWVPSLQVSYTDVVLTDLSNGVTTLGNFYLDQPLTRFTA